MKQERLYLLHIIESIQHIEDYTQDGYETFVQSTLIQHAVIRNFEVIGEAARRISDQTRLQYPFVPWRHMIGFRNVLIHDYDTIDLDRVWNILKDELPTLKQQIEAIVKRMDQQ